MAQLRRARIAAHRAYSRSLIAHAKLKDRLKRCQDAIIHHAYMGNHTQRGANQSLAAAEATEEKDLSSEIKGAFSRCKIDEAALAAAKAEEASFKKKARSARGAAVAVDAAADDEGS